MFRTRFAMEIVAEFLPPVRQGKRRKAIILCDGMPSVPTKQPLAEFLARRGYWVFYPRWRGAWESGGRFLEKSPVQDIADVITGIRKGAIRENAFGQVFKPSPDEIFVIGGSFGGTAAILGSLDRRVKKTIANCPVVDWSVLRRNRKRKRRTRATPPTSARPLATAIASRTGTGTSCCGATFIIPQGMRRSWHRRR